MKKFYLLSVILCFFNVCIFCQQISDNLRLKLSDNNSEELININIYLKESTEKVVNKIIEKNYRDQREKKVEIVKGLKSFCSENQEDIVSYLNEENAVDLKRHWLLNMVSCKLNKKAIKLIASRADVDFITLNDMEKVLFPVESDMERSVLTMGNIENRSWNLDKVKTLSVWETGYVGQNIVVSVLDTGINYNHEDIKDNMWKSDEFPNHGWDFVNEDNDPMDDQGHGSHCAGTVAGNGASGIMTGIAPGAKIMAVKVANSVGMSSSSLLISGMEFSIENGADIFSISLGFGADMPEETEKLREAMINVMNLGIPAFVAAGNDYSKINSTKPIPYNVGTPGNCPPPWLNPEQPNHSGKSAVICIGATTVNDTRSSFSSVGPSTWEDVTPFNDYIYSNGSKPGIIRPDVVFPGTDITSLDFSTNNGYKTSSGTSMATPGAAGVCALLLSKNRSLTPEDICRILETTAVKVSGMTIKNNEFGSGRIDAFAAINIVDAENAEAPVISVENENSVQLRWTDMSDKEGFIGYDVYKNGAKINKNRLSESKYSDLNLKPGLYIYYINAVYSNAEIMSKASSVNISTRCNAPEEMEVRQLKDNILIEWKMPKDAETNVKGYNIYVNNSQVNDNLILSNSFIDESNKTAGETYTYKIDAFYESGCYSKKVEAGVVKYETYEEHCFAPKNLKAIKNENADEVALTWEKPYIELSWSNNEYAGGFGNEKTTFYVASKWTSSQLRPYMSMKLTEISLFPVEEAEFTLIIWEPGIVKYEQPLTSLQYGKLNKVKLENPYTIDFSKDLRVGYKVVYKNGAKPVGYDSEVNAKNNGNLISFDGKKWEYLKDYDIKANWLLSVKFEDFLGIPPMYNIYRNGILMNNEPVYETNYSDDYSVLGKDIEYHVIAQYENCKSDPSNIAKPESDGIFNPSMIENMDFYPNPASSSVTLNGNYKSVMIYENSGRLIRTDFIETSSNNYEMNINELPAGFYYIKAITSEGMIRIGKLVKIN